MAWCHGVLPRWDCHDVKISYRDRTVTASWYYVEARWPCCYANVTPSSCNGVIPMQANRLHHGQRHHRRNQYFQAHQQFLLAPIPRSPVRICSAAQPRSTRCKPAQSKLTGGISASYTHTNHSVIMVVPRKRSRPPSPTHWRGGAG